MTLKFLSRAGLAGLAALAIGYLFARPELRADAGDRRCRRGTAGNRQQGRHRLDDDLASVLVLMMTVPGLALFYGGLVRAKNMASVLSQVLMIVCLVCVIWVIYGYSLAFTGGSAFIGGFSKVFLSGVSLTRLSDTFTKGVAIPEYVFICFQMTFAAITPALIVGGFAERIKFPAVMLFTALWVTFVYFPIAHMVWHGDGYLFKLGALDFAGGTVVHINAGIAALVGALIIGKRTGYGKDLLSPHSMTLTLVGGGMLWVGWFGFNAGSNLEATAPAALGTDQHLRCHCGRWSRPGCSSSGSPRANRRCSGWSPALSPVWSRSRRLPVSPVRWARSSSASSPPLSHSSSARPSRMRLATTTASTCSASMPLPASSARSAPASLSAPCSAALASTATPWAARSGNSSSRCVVAILWSGIGSLILYKIVDILIGLRVSVDEEREGLDLTEHGERAYHM